MVAISFAVLSAVAGVLIQSAQAAPSPTTAHVDEFVRRDADAPPFVKRAASCTFPSPPKTSTLSKPITVTGTFDGKYLTRLKVEHALNDSGFVRWQCSI
jgi:hypothetical protein